MADDLGITRAALVDALALRISEQRIARIAAGIPSTRIPSAAAVGVVASIIGYRGYLSGPSPEGGPATLSSAEFSAALEDVTAEHGVTRADSSFGSSGRRPKRGSPTAPQSSVDERD